jgi:hypothetical protein
MDRESLIRRMSDIAFAILFGGALVLGGDAALAGLPKFLDATVPGMVAQAGEGDGLAQGVARFAVPPGFMKNGSSGNRVGDSEGS